MDLLESATYDSVSPGICTKNCGYITKALTQRWESFLKQEMQKRNGAYFFFTNIY